MWMDVVDLRDFYATSLGRVAQRMIRRRLREEWPDVRGLSVLGFGYCTPYLRPFLDEADRVVAAMPAAQGVVHWPPEAPFRTVLADDGELPLPDRSMDRVLLVHSVECGENLRQMMREIWRVMSDSGRLLAIVPNRRGVWARVDNNPFGHGRPYTTAQLSRLLRDNLFTPVASANALFMPPSRSRVMLGAAQAWEKLGARWFPRFSGVVMIEATKQIYAGAGVRAQRRRSYAVVPQGLERRLQPPAPPQRVMPPGGRDAE
ncbi:MAG: methyltransferase domain-containing protein [Alphaproteobacteria bacterium]